MMVATSLVLVLTTVAPLLGPHLSGILATFPIFGTVLAFFAHRQQGPAAARQVLTGLCAGLYGFAAFFLVLGLTMEKLGIATGFLAASAATLAVHAVSWRVLRRREPSGGA
jgi:drug/metabolite transporter (DMT)-like permease